MSAISLALNILFSALFFLLGTAVIFISDVSVLWIMTSLMLFFCLGFDLLLWQGLGKEKCCCRKEWSNMLNSNLGRSWIWNLLCCACGFEKFTQSIFPPIFKYNKVWYFCMENACNYIYSWRFLLGVNLKMKKPGVKWVVKWCLGAHMNGWEVHFDIILA